MSALDILYRAIDRSVETEGWNNTMLLCIACDYIDNQQSPEAFEDFVEQQLAEPPKGKPEDRFQELLNQGWDPDEAAHQVDFEFGFEEVE